MDVGEPMESSEHWLLQIDTSLLSVHTQICTSSLDVRLLWSRLHIMFKLIVPQPSNS
ncbi:hypothetical protein FRC03_001968 [Tulasnella sp. 419]|nr:hypothetical protein FRC03_001968 [Tulasnella sp. 419]